MPCGPASATDAAAAPAVREWLTLQRSKFFECSDLAGRDAIIRETACRLLNEVCIVVGNRRQLLVEIEAYVRSEEHQDVFAHASPYQQRIGWYFHRAGSNGAGEFKGGTYLGCDIAWGGPGQAAGFLVRAVRDEGARASTVWGSCLVVRTWLDRSGCPRVAELDKACRTRLDWFRGTPLCLEWRPAGSPLQEVLQGPRVGLTLKKYAWDSPLRAAAETFVMADYRFAVDSTAEKGRVLNVLALLRDGIENADVVRRTGCSTRALVRYAAAYSSGHRLDSVDHMFGRGLTTNELCQLYGFLVSRRRP